MNKATRPIAMLILHKAEEHTPCIEVDLKQGFQKCSFYREHPAQPCSPHINKECISMRCARASVPSRRQAPRHCFLSPLALESKLKRLTGAQRITRRIRRARARRGLYDETRAHARLAEHDSSSCHLLLPRKDLRRRGPLFPECAAHSPPPIGADEAATLCATQYCAVKLPRSSRSAERAAELTIRSFSYTAARLPQATYTNVPRTEQPILPERYHLLAVAEGCSSCHLGYGGSRYILRRSILCHRQLAAVRQRFGPPPALNTRRGFTNISECPKCLAVRGLALDTEVLRFSAWAGAFGQALESRLCHTRHTESRNKRLYSVKRNECKHANQNLALKPLPQENAVHVNDRVSGCAFLVPEELVLVTLVYYHSVEIGVKKEIDDKCDKGLTAKKSLSFHQGEPGSIPGGVAPGFPHVRNRAGRCRWSAGFLGYLPFPPAPSFPGAAPILIGSQGPAVKSRPQSLPANPHSVALGHAKHKHLHMHGMLAGENSGRTLQGAGYEEKATCDPEGLVLSGGGRVGVGAGEHNLHPGLAAGRGVAKRACARVRDGVKARRRNGEGGGCRVVDRGTENNNEDELLCKSAQTSPASSTHIGELVVRVTPSAEPRAGA
ncbi:hypothetical protein PR048_018984 [Dryococelus australis]|uniref:Uncharacterized protein n=1 Tax=Dryococelus australis TaxID=614101 RepID=A0ABQ9H2J5_9NEOP|nr:hypothetical protein PR048_018984 [Dryococelus australis]